MLPFFDKSLYRNQHESFYTFCPKTLLRKIKFFKKNFKAEILYAVKTNPSGFILEKLASLGIKSFDVASLNEIKIIRDIVSDAQIYFMNPIKPRYSINQAYFNYNVKNFALDSSYELKKILDETNNASDLVLHLRLNILNNFSKINLSNKFGIDIKSAPNLLKKIKRKSHKIGVCFHTGSQCMHPSAYKIAIRIAIEVVKKSEINIDFLNVGGGFPSVYPGLEPTSLNDYFDEIHREFLNLQNFSSNTMLLSEPGRALVAECMSLAVRVDLRKGNKLYINDGIYGSLNNAGFYGFNYPVKLLNREDKNSEIVPFSFFGPTCDAGDFMKGPFNLPDSVREGDWIEIGQMGAYSTTMRTNFNGFFSEPKVFLVDKLATNLVNKLNLECAKDKISRAGKI